MKPVHGHVIPGICMGTESARIQYWPTGMTTLISRNTSNKKIMVIIAKRIFAAACGISGSAALGNQRRHSFDSWGLRDARVTFRDENKNDWRE